MLTSPLASAAADAVPDRPGAESAATVFSATGITLSYRIRDDGLTGLPVPLRDGDEPNRTTGSETLTDPCCRAMTGPCFEDDPRDFPIGARILRHTGICQERLVTNDSAEIARHPAQGGAVAERVPLRASRKAQSIRSITTRFASSGQLS